MTSEFPSEQPYKLDPEKFPKQLTIDLPTELAEHFQRLSLKTGRSIDELILEALDKELGEY
jgi:predicted DNA-binding protein